MKSSQIDEFGRGLSPELLSQAKADLGPLAAALEAAREKLKAASAVESKLQARLTALKGEQALAEEKYEDARGKAFESAIAGKVKDAFRAVQELKSERDWMKAAIEHLQLWPLAMARLETLSARAVEQNAEADCLDAVGAVEMVELRLSARIAVAAGAFMMMPSNGNVLEAAKLRKGARDLEEQAKRFEAELEENRRKQ